MPLGRDCVFIKHLALWEPDLISDSPGVPGILIIIN